MRIIALHGKAGAGKDTFADRLVEKHGFVKRGFADPLYEEVADAFGVTVEWLRDRGRKESPQQELALWNCADGNFAVQMLNAGEIANALPRSPRWMLQKWGTEYRRGQRDTYWLERMHDYMKCRVGPFVIPDCRFENEARWVGARFGTIIEIRRSNLPPVAAHASEAGIPKHLIDDVIYNDWQIAALYELADQRGGMEVTT